MKKVRWLTLLVALCTLLASLPAARAGGEEPFEPRYNARVDKQSSLRSIPDESGRRVATLYRDDVVELDELGEEWTPTQKGNKVGYLLTSSLKNIEILSPYHMLPEGEQLFPYAATALGPTVIAGTLYGSAKELQTIPEGSVIAVGAPDENGDLLLPYMRTVGRVSGDRVRLEPVVPIDEAQPGDLIAVYSTFFSADLERALIKGRLHNIEKGVALLDGVVVQMGEEFSFNKICGPYSKANGYQRGPIINYTSSEKSGYGGGICQVTTTLHNALLQVYVYIVRGEPHSSRGIEYAPVGFDAAVGEGRLDYIFENDLPFAMRMNLNVWDGVLTVRLYRDAGE